MSGETNLGALATEAVRPDGLDLGATSTPLLVGMMADDLADVQAAIRGASAATARAIDLIAERMRAGGRLIYLGAGTSGRLALMDAAECVPTFSADPGQVLALIAGGAEAAGSAVEGAEDNPLAAHLAAATIAVLRRLDAQSRRFAVVGGLSTHPAFTAAVTSRVTAGVPGACASLRAVMRSTGPRCWPAAPFYRCRLIGAASRRAVRGSAV